MPLEVANVLENDVGRLVLLQDRDYFVKQRTSRAIPAAVLGTGLGKRLTRETGAENVVLWYFSLEFSNVAGDSLPRFGKVSRVQFSKLVIDLRRENTLMP